MKWRLSSHYAFAASLFTVLILVNVTATPGSTTQVDDQRKSAVRSRGTSRFRDNPSNPEVNAPSIEDVARVSVQRRAGSSSTRKVSTTEAAEVASGGRRYLPEKRGRVIRPEKSSFADVGLEAPEVSHDGKTLPKTPGPSVFASTLGSHSRSRTGRKIQNTGGQVRRKNEENVGHDFGKTESRIETPDTLEVDKIDDAGSVRVDIPLIRIVDEVNPSSTTVFPSRSRTRSRQASVTKSESSESSSFAPRNNVRRGGSKYNFETTEISKEEIVTQSVKSRGDKRSRNDSVKRLRNLDSRVEDEATSRTTRIRGRKVDGRSRIETPISTTTTTTTTTPTIVATEEPGINVPTKTIELETTEVTTVTEVTNFESSTLSETKKIKAETRFLRGRTRSNQETRRSDIKREENRSSRIRKTSTTEATSRNQLRGTRSRGAVTLANEGSTPKSLKKSKIEEEDTKLSIAGDEEFKKVTISDGDLSSSASPTTDRVVSTTETIPKRRGFKRLNVKPKDEREELSTASSLNSEVTFEQRGKDRRGSRGAKNERNSDNRSEKKDIKILEDANDEEENYPPGFKARLAMLKNSNPVTKITPAVTKSTPRLGIQNLKKPSPAIFSTNARLKLEKSKKLVNLSAVTEENETEIESTTPSATLATTASPSPPRNSLFGKRPKLAAKTEDQSFGKIRKSETISNVKSSKVSSNVETVPEIPRPTRPRLNFAKRRNAPTTESLGDLDVATVTPKPVSLISKIDREEKNSYKLSQNGKNPSVVTDSSEDSLVSKTTRGSPRPVKTFVSKRLRQRSTAVPNIVEPELVTTLKPPSTRYARRKHETKSYRKFDFLPSTSTESTEAKIVARREFRPRTATYRRHSEAPPAPVIPNIEPLTTPGPISISITPKTAKFRATFKSDAALPITNAKTVNVQISDNPSSENDPNSAFSNSNDSGIVGKSNGETDNGDTNVFSPTRILQFMNRNSSFIEQIRSTVAPLLSSLGLKTPVFEGAYRNITSSGNSAIRVTPSGQPPRFSARYKGAELFVRRPTNVYQPTVPSVVSSTTPMTPNQVPGISSGVDISNSGEPKIFTYYQAVETASVNNEQLTDIQQRPMDAGQVVGDNVSDINDDTNNTKNDINAAKQQPLPQLPIVDSRFIGNETSSPDTSENNGVSIQPETTQSNSQITTTQLPDPTTTTVAGIDNTVATSSTAQPEIELNSVSESTPNPVTTAESLTETNPSLSETTTSQSSLDIPSTTLASDTNAIVTPSLDTTLASDVEETSSSLSSEPFERLTTNPTTPISPLSDSTSPQDLETTTNLLSNEIQQSSSEITLDAGTEFPQASTQSSTETFETTPAPLLQARFQNQDTDASTSEPATESTQDTPNPESAPSSSEPSVITTTATNVADTTQITSSTFARISDFENPDLTTIASSTQEPTTPSSLDIMAIFGSTTTTTTTLSQVTTQQDTEVTTPTIPANESLDLETPEVTSTQSIGQSNTATPTTTTTTTLQSTERIVEQETETVSIDTSVTESELPSSTASNQLGTLLLATVTPAQGDNLATTLSVNNLLRIAETGTESANEGTSVTESDIPSSTTRSQAESIELENTTITPTQSIGQSDDSTTPPTIATTLQNTERIVEQETESFGLVTSFTESSGSGNTPSDQARSLELETTTVTSTQSVGELETVTRTSATIKTTLLENLQQTVEQRSGFGSSTESDLSGTTISGRSESFIELGIATVTATQLNTESDTTTPITITTQNTQGSRLDTEESVTSVTDRDAPNGDIGFSGDLSVGTTATSVLTNSDDSSLATTSFETPSESTTISVGNRNFESITVAVPATTGASFARITENLDTQTTVATDTTTVAISDETTTKITTEITNSVSFPQLLGGFIDNSVSVATSSQETTIQSTQTVSPFETTTLNLGSRFLANNDDNDDDLVETTTTTQDTILTTPTLIVTTETSLGDDTLIPNPGENDTTDLTTTNQSNPSDLTTESISERSTSPEPTPTSFITDTQTLLARLQDVTATTTATVTAQGTAGLDVQATTLPNETSNIPESTPSSITQAPTTPAPTSNPQVSNDVSTPEADSPLITTTNLPDANAKDSTTISSRSGADLTATTEDITTLSITTVMATSAPETTTTTTTTTTVAPTSETTLRIEDNLIPDNGDTTTTETLNEIDRLTTTSSEQTITTQAPLVTTTIANPPQISSRNEPIVADRPTIQQTFENGVDLRARINPFAPTSMPQYVGRFGDTRLTPAPRFSPSSSTTTPLRDYFVYGIYPNKTIVRKRPEDNAIDGRNVDSPYVIFGIYPDGKLVRKFPNGTVIPDPPRNPVEVVFSLSTTTTNRPSPVFYNQANTGYYNQISPIYNNRPVASIYNQNANRFPGDNAALLPGNTITGYDGGFTGFPGVGIANKKMSDILLETQFGRKSNTLSEIGDLLTTIPNGNAGGLSQTTPGTPFVVTPSNIQGGGRISQERESDEASRSREANGQRSSVYIGQEKFINYWSDSSPNTSPRVLSVRINSVAGSSNLGPAGSSIPSFSGLPGTQSDTVSGGRPAGSRWADPLDQIFGITTSSPAITTSVTTNILTMLDDSGTRNIPPRPINPFVEVFTPVSSSIDSTVGNSITPESPSARLIEEVSPSTTTTTKRPITSTTTTTTSTTTTTTTPAPTTTTTTTTTTTPAPITTTSTTTTTTTPEPRVSSQILNTESLPIGTTEFPEKTAPFGKSVDDLVFLNSLLQQGSGDTSGTKTLTDAEQFLANTILSLALEKIGPTRSPKAIKPANASPNSFYDFSTGKPIVIDLLPSTPTQATIRSSTPPSVSSTQFTWRPVSTNPVAQPTWKPIIVTPKETEVRQRPKATQQPKPRTTPPPQGFGASIFSALFGGNPFIQTPAPTPLRPRKPPTTTTTTTSTTTTTTSTTTTTTARPTTPKTVNNGITVLLNNPNPRVPTLPSSTFSPEDDAKFLAALINSGQLGASSSGISKDDEAFLRAILNGKANVKPASPRDAGNSGGNDAALLAALLQAQGIVPTTPTNNLREQMKPAGTKPPPRRPASTAWSPSSTYPPSIFDSFAGFGSNSPESGTNAPIPGDGTVRSQVVNAAIGATKAFSRFLGAAFTGAAQQFQSFVKNGTRYVSEAVG